MDELITRKTIAVEGSHGRIPPDGEAVNYVAMDSTDGLVRLVSAAFRRYSRDPETRSYSTRHLLTACLALAAEYNDLGEVSLITADTLSELRRQNRSRERSVG